MSQSDIWTEKYRPLKFEEVVGQQEIIKRVRSLVQSLNIPHFLFAGPAGTGKSTLALIVVKSLFGSVDFSSFQRSYGTLFNSEYFFFVNSITFCAYSVSSIVP